MLGVIALIFGSFAYLILSSYRRARRLEEEGQPFEPEGKLRWGSEKS